MSQPGQGCSSGRDDHHQVSPLGGFRVGTDRIRGVEEVGDHRAAGDGRHGVGAQELKG